MTNWNLRVPKLVPLSKIDPVAVEQLLDSAFGPDRHERTAYKIRAGVDALPDLSFAAIGDDEGLLGTAQSWPIIFSPYDGSPKNLVMVGPVAVLPATQGQGIGQLLTDAICEQLDATAQSAMLIGDADYYDRFFGFVSGPASQWTLPGPAEPDRILLRAHGDTQWPAQGVLGADVLRSRR